MNIVVDTNIVFSTLLNPRSSIGEILMNIQDQFTFFAPELLKEELISKKSWAEAYALTKDVDEDDTPFVALAIELHTGLWTGDKVLREGLIKKGSAIIISTSDLKKQLK